MTKGYPRKKRAPRAQSARKASQEANSASKSRGLIKRRMMVLESRLTVLERLCWQHLAPDLLLLDNRRMSDVHPYRLVGSAEEE